ncbi:MAG TPA: MmcQ/YjbR family DNA-binding protein [Rhodanobacteraceae bacterium]|nr:MmcQ/YjbR family DNA-binding protein [Rhodanobacteraceae bacterium]
MNETPYDRLKSTALELPEVQEATSYGTPALKVRGKLMLRLREDGTIAFRTTWEQREELIEMYPKVFFVNDHFRKYDWTLARIENLYEGQIRQIVHTAWCNTAPKAVRKELLR